MAEPRTAAKLGQMAPLPDERARPDRGYRSSMPWVDIGIVVAGLLVLGVPVLLRCHPDYWSPTAFSPSTRRMDLEVSTANFVVEIHNRDLAWHSGCRANVDNRYSFDSPLELPPFFGPGYRTAKTNLADFTRGRRRYDWKNRSPATIEAVCKRYVPAPLWSLTHNA